MAPREPPISTNLPRKTWVIIAHENNSTAYSDRKIKAKKAPEYSVLNPETSSDSDSAKSKGARCVSASVQTSQRGSRRRWKVLDNEVHLWIEKDPLRRTSATTSVLKTDS